MNNITYAVSVDVNNPIIPYNVYIASVLDSNVRYLEITLYQNGNVITLSNTATATASLVTDNVLVDDSVECTISNNIITVPLEDLQRHGNLDVQVTVTEGTKVLAIPFPIRVRVTPNIAEEAQIDEDSLGSYAEVVQEIAEARNGHNSLDERLNSDASGMEAVINKVQSIGSQSQTFDNVKYPSVTAVRDYVNVRNDDLEDYIENELDELDEAKADKTDTNAQFERLIAVLQNKAGKAETLAGYGINDAYTKAETDSLVSTYVLTNQDKSDIADIVLDELPTASVTPEKYGAAGDGVTDDTVAVQSAIDYSIAHKVPFRGKTGAVYLISKPIQIVMSESRAFYGAFDFDGSTIKTTDTFSDNFTNICLVMNRKPDDWESAYSNYYKSENGQFVPVTLVSNVVPGFSSDTFYAKRSCALLICISAHGHWQKHAKTSIKNLVIDGNRESVHTGIMVERTEGFIFENINIYDTRRGIYLSDTCTETMIRKCTARRSNYSGITYDLDLYNQISNNQLNLDGAFPESDRSEELLDGRINLLKTQCVGFEMNTADAFIQDCVAIDYVIGVKIMAGDNKVYGCHIWNTMLNQLRSDCCFMQSAGNYFVNNTCDHFYIGIYTLYSMPSYFVNTLFTSNSLSGNDFSNDINYCWYLGQYASRSKGCDITVIGTNIHSNLKNLNTSKRLLAWCNVDRPAFRDVGTKGYGIIGYQPAEDGTVNYKKLEVDNNGVIPMLPECAETEYGTRPQDYNDETGIIIGEGARLGIIRTAGCRLKMKIDDNGKHTFQMLPSARENPPSIMSVYIGYKDGMDYMEEGHDYILKFRYKNNNSKALLSLNHTEKAVAQHGDLPALIPKMSNADETSLPSFRRYLAYDGEEHSAYCMFKFRKDLAETVTENGENVTYLRKVFPSIRIAASDFSVDSELIISDIRLFDITDLPRYFLETRWAYLNRISDFIGSAADDVDTSRSSDISFVATEYPVDIDYEPNNKWGDYYKIRYDDVGRPLVSALTAETGGNEAANYALIPVNSKLIFDAIIYHSSNESNSIYLSDSLSQKQKGYSITSKPQPSPVVFEREDSPVKLLLKNSTLQNKKILSFRIGSKLECDAPVTDNGGFVPTFSTGKVYLVKKNSAETETLPTVKIKEAYAKAGGNDWAPTEQELDDIAQRAVSLIPTTQGVLYGNTSD